MCSACSNGKSQSQAAVLSGGRAAPVCYSISHSALILWNVNHPSHQNAGSHISNNLLDKIPVSCSSLSSRSTCESTVEMYFKSLGFSLQKIITVNTVAIQRNWISVIRLCCIMHMFLSLDSSPLMLFMDHLFLSSFLHQWTEVSIETLGRRPRLLCPAHQGAAPRLCPSPASTPISQSKCVSPSVRNVTPTCNICLVWDINVTATHNNNKGATKACEVLHAEHNNR